MTRSKQVKAFWEDSHITIWNKSCTDMSDLADNSIQCVVTSPPYWGLRKYAGSQDLVWGSNGNTWRGAYGLEPTVDLYVQHSVEILREIRRVLRKDGVVFWNIGDSYAGGGNYRGLNSENTLTSKQASNRGARGTAQELSAIGKDTGSAKPKDLCLIPFRVALAVQEPYQEFTIKNLADRAWLAGIIDGEGCISIHHYERSENGEHYHQFQPFISVGSIDPPLIERIVRITRMNGTRQKTEVGDMDGRGIISRHANYEWRVEGENAIKVIEDVFPNLTIKRKQAILAYELAQCHAPHSGKGHKVPADITTHKLALWQMVKDCNQRKDVEVSFPEPSAHIEPGWWVRSVIIWSKNNPMPESVRDRPTESHEYILMLTKSANYYWDQEAVREPVKKTNLGACAVRPSGDSATRDREHWGVPHEKGEVIREYDRICGANLRSVWTFSTQPYPEAHFATFPERLPELCIKAATPEYGCCDKCGTPWERVIEKGLTAHDGKTNSKSDPAEKGNAGAYGRLAQLRQAARERGGEYVNESKTLGWLQACKCQDSNHVPSTVLDCFAGSGTTLWVAKKLGRKSVGYELSEEYCNLIIERNRQQAFGRT